MQTLKLYDNIKLANSYGFSKIEKSSLCVISLAKLNIQIMSFIFKDKCTISITWKLLQGTWKLKILKHVFNIYSVQDYRYKLVSLNFASFKCKCGNYSNPYLSGFNGSWQYLTVLHYPKFCGYKYQYNILICTLTNLLCETSRH